MTFSAGAAVVLLILGAVFFLAGTVGLLRFPDVYSRLHALTKADNLGLGLSVFGLALLADTWVVALKLIFLWILVLASSTTAAQVVAAAARDAGIVPYRRRKP